MSGDEITFLNDLKANYSLINDSFVKTEPAPSSEDTIITKWSLSSGVAIGLIKEAKCPDDEDYKYIIPVYKQNDEEILMRIPVIKELKSYNPKSFSEAVYKSKTIFNPIDKRKMEFLRDYIKENINYLLNTNLNEIKLTGFSTLTNFQKGLALDFLNMLGMTDVEDADNVVVYRYPALILPKVVTFP